MMNLLRTTIMRPSLFPVRRNSLAGNQRGTAIIVVLLLIAIIVALVADFVYEVYIDSTSVSNWGNAQQASLIARSGQTLSTRYLEEVNQGTYSDTRMTVLPVDYDFGPNSSLIIEIEDENAKFNVNGIIDQFGKTKEVELASLKKLFEFLSINQELALIIADWIDPDSEPRLSNSEDDAKNDFLWSIDELRLIEGIDAVFDQITPYITVYETSSNLSLININTAELPVIYSLAPEMTKTLAQNIIDERNNFPFERTEQVNNVSGMEGLGTPLIGTKIFTKSVNFRITTKATVNEITRIIESVTNTSMNVLYWRET